MNKYFILLLFLLQSCADSMISTSCDLVFLEKKEFLLDENIYYFSKAIFSFRDETTGREYLSFENNEKSQHEIIVFEMDSEEIVKRIDVKRQGPNAIAMFGHYPVSMDSFYVTSISHQRIYKIDSNGEIVKIYEFNVTDENEPLSLNFSVSFVYNPLIIKDSCIYLPQTVLTDIMNGDKWSETSITAKLDMRNMAVSKVPLKFPRLFEKESFLTSSIEIGYSFDSNENAFIYSFFKSDSIIVTKDFLTVHKYPAKSRYIKSVKSIPDLGSDMFTVERKSAEQGMYWHFAYDKYRDLYYRFVLFPCEVKSNDDIIELNTIRQEFSIIIMNNDFEIIGENKFPKDKYLPKMFFVGEKGLYISENNPNNPAFNEDKLVFSCFVPEYN